VLGKTIRRFSRSDDKFLSLNEFVSVSWLVLAVPRIVCTAGSGVHSRGIASSFSLARYAQEARPYSLWPALILLSCAPLLRAMRLQTKLSWTIYAVANILVIYTHLFSLLVGFGHVIYLVGSQGFTLNKKVVSYLIASAVSLLAFLPWMGFLMVN